MCDPVVPARLVGRRSPARASRCCHRRGSARTSIPGRPGYLARDDSRRHGLRSCTRRRSPPTRSTSVRRSSFRSRSRDSRPSPRRGWARAKNGSSGSSRAMRYLGLLYFGLPESRIPRRPSLRRCARSRISTDPRPPLLGPPADRTRSSSRRARSSSPASDPAHHRDSPRGRCVRALRLAEGTRALSGGDACRAWLADLARGLRRGSRGREAGRARAAVPRARRRVGRPSTGLTV